MRKLLKNNNLHFQAGFSLAELSVVIVVIGLLTAGVAGGLRLRDAAELRSIITDVEKIRIVIESFEQKYDALPGDMTDAHDYWDDGSDGVCGVASQCNGDGDGIIEGGGGLYDRESLRAWQHLSLAGMISGSYTGNAAGTPPIRPGGNIYPSKLKQGGFNFYIYFPFVGANEGGQEIHFATYDALSFDIVSEPILTPVQAKAIDSKTDDGLPDSGLTQGRYHYDATDTAWKTSECLAGTYPNRTYDVSRSAVECIMFFDGY